MNLQPYVFFYGRCEEALEFYKKAIGGSYNLQRVKDSGMDSSMPFDAGERIMHATFKGPGVTFMASDGQDVKAVDPDAGNIALSLDCDDAAEGERVFQALSAGGSVTMPFDKSPWGAGKFGVCTDKFGIEWMMSTP